MSRENKTPAIYGKYTAIKFVSLKLEGKKCVFGLKRGCPARVRTWRLLIQRQTISFDLLAKLRFFAEIKEKIVSTSEKCLKLAYRYTAKYTAIFFEEKKYPAFGRGISNQSLGTVYRYVGKGNSKIVEKCSLQKNSATFTFTFPSAPSFVFHFILLILLVLDLRLSL